MTIQFDETVNHGAEMLDFTVGVIVTKFYIENILSAFMICTFYGKPFLDCCKVCGVAKQEPEFHNLGT